jgi:hypothetical protein
MSEPEESEDFYWEGDFIVFTSLYHLKRGYCCGSRCRHCPYDPRWTSGATTVAREKTASPLPGDLFAGDNPPR